MNLYNHCIAILAKSGKVVFERSLVIKLTPHTPPVLIREVYAYHNQLFIIDKAGNTTGINENDSEVIPNSLYQRLKILGFNEA